VHCGKQYRRNSVVLIYTTTRAHTVMHFSFSDTVWATQWNRKLCRGATIKFWRGNPLEHRDLELAAVLKCMGLPDDRPIHHEGHPVVNAFKAANSDMKFILAPEVKGASKSSILGEAPVFRQFQAMFGMSLAALWVSKKLFAEN
jgi:hypothetical protein